VTLTYAYLVTWILGGLALLTIVFMRTQRRPYWLAIGLMAFGATGFVMLGSKLAPLPQTAIYAGALGVLGALFGFGVERLGRPSEGAAGAAAINRD
jgi:hypothetical protein